jgi:hypothetical protein
MAEICWLSRFGDRLTRLKHLSRELVSRERVGPAVRTGRAKDRDTSMETGQTSDSNLRTDRNRRQKNQLAGAAAKPPKTEKADLFPGHTRQAWQATAPR